MVRNNPVLLNGLLSRPQHSDAPNLDNQIHPIPPYTLDEASRNRILRETPSEGGVVTGRNAPSHWTADGPLVDMPRGAMFLGDFNLTPMDPEYELLAGSLDPRYGRISRLDGLVDVWHAVGNDPSGGLTCGRDDGMVRIDYAFMTPGLVDRVSRMWVDESAQGSDHQPIFVKF